jgi:ribosome-associated protein
MAQNIVVMNVSRVFLIADYFVICSSNSSVQAKSIALEIEEELQKRGIGLIGKEGIEDARWILLDSGSIVVHIFEEESREFYDLESLWGDARTIKWQRSARKRKCTESA